jgi:peroxiredoxin
MRKQLLLAAAGFTFLLAVAVGDPAPDFTLQDTSNLSHQLLGYRGKVVYLFFFGYN